MAVATAEASTLTTGEKSKIIEIVKKNAGNLPVVVGIGGNDTQKVIDNIKSTNLNGVAGLLVVTPYYNKPTQEGLSRHFMTLADKVDLPIVLYNHPGRTGVTITPQTAVELAAALGTSPELWLNLEASYRLARVHPPDPAIARRAKLARVS